MDYFIFGAVAAYFLSSAGYMLFLAKQKERYCNAGFLLNLAGFVCLTGVLALGFAESGHVPVSNMRETLVLAAWAISGVFIAFQTVLRLKVLGAFTVPMCLVITTVAANLPSTQASETAIFKSGWLLFHVLAIFAGDAALVLAFGIGLLYLLQENAIKSKSHGFFYKRLPPLETLDHAGYVCLKAGFSLLTLGLIVGFVYARAVWGRFISWDPKEVWSFITWLVYAALLHQRYVAGWRGKRAAVMSVIGFFLLVFTFLGVNFLFSGHHGVFTK